MAELSAGRRRLVLAICCLSLLIVGMDTTIVNVALPSIRADLGASVGGLQWTVDAYTVVLASLLLLAGSTGDRLGRRRTFQAGLVLFTAGSLLCSLAPGLGWLIVFRMVQAVGGSMLNPVAMSIITNVFTDRRERARAIGVWGGVVGISLGVGPIVGGLLTETIGWRSIFWVNVPIGVAALVLAALFVPESRAARPRRLDPLGQGLVIVALASLTYAIIDSPQAGWGSARVLVLAAVAALALVGLLVHEPRRAEPLIELRFFRSVPFTGATVIAVAVFGAFSAFLFLNTLYLQDVRHLSALQAGLFLLPMAAATAVLAPVSGRIVANRGARLPLGTGRHRDRAERSGAHHGQRYDRLSGAHHVVPGVRRRLRSHQRTDHQHRGVRHAGVAGRRGGGGRLDQPPDRRLARCGRGGAGGQRRGRRGAAGEPGGRQPPGLVGGVGRRGAGAGARSGDHGPPGPRHGRPDRGTVAHRRRTRTGGRPVTGPQAGGGEPAVAAWRAMRSLVLDSHDRRAAVCEAVGLSFLRVKALLQLAGGSRTMSELAAALELRRTVCHRRRGRPAERRALVNRSAHHGGPPGEGGQHHRRGVPNSRRGRGALLEEPPAALVALPAPETEALAATLTRLAAADAHR